MSPRKTSEKTIMFHECSWFQIGETNFQVYCDFQSIQEIHKNEFLNEEVIKEYMGWDAIEINIELNMGKSDFTVYTCDFTKDYIDINTDYRH